MRRELSSLVAGLLLTGCVNVLNELDIDDLDVTNMKKQLKEYRAERTAEKTKKYELKLPEIDNLGSYRR